MSEELFARAVGAAVAQRKLASPSEIDSLHFYRSGVLADKICDAQTAIDRIDKFLVSRAIPAAERRNAPDVVPPSVQGSNVAAAGGTTDENGWHAGVGAHEMARFVDEEIRALNPMFIGAAAYYFAALVELFQ